MKCKHCYGTGEEPDSYDISKADPVTPCIICKGSGHVDEEDHRPDHIGTNFTPNFNSMEYKKYYR